VIERAAPQGAALFRVRARNRANPKLVRRPMSQLFIGTYAKPGGRGVYPLTLAVDGGLTLGECAAPARNSSFGACSPTHGIHYLVDECDSRLTAWRRDGDRWQQLANVPTSGSEPCYVALDEQHRRLAVANYKSGSLALFALDAKGLFSGPSAAFQDRGSGPVGGRQDGPHVHCVRFSPDRRFLYAVDLGADHVLRFELAADRLDACQIAYRAPAGSGPRHLLFHPERPFALLISELASTLTLLAVDEGRLEPLATCSTIPPDWHGDNLGGHLAWPSTGRAYVSNRGHDSLALIEVDLDGGSLTPVQHVPSGGQSPRHFLLLEESPQLVAAHEKDGAVTSFRIEDDGRLAPTGQRLTLPGACFVFRG
jgi:6-phosphogluconolactonase